MPAIAGVLAVVMLFAVSLTAKDLVVSKSPVSPDTTHALSGDAFEQPLLAVRLEAVGGDVTVEGFELTVSGTGSPVTQMTGLSVWLDDGDGEFDAQLDTALWSGPSAAVVTVALAPTVLVGDGLFVDIWVVASFAPDAGSSLGLTYSVGIAATSDVTVESGSSVVVSFGASAPQSVELRLVLLRVDRVEHANCYRIDIEGSGLTPPVQVYVGGMLIEGVMEVNEDHTFASLKYVRPDPSPPPSHTWVELSTAAVERYPVNWGVNFDACYGHRPSIDSCVMTSGQDSLPWLILLGAILLGAVRCTVRRLS